MIPFTRLPDDWTEALRGYISASDLDDFYDFIDGCYSRYSDAVNPARERVFRAFSCTPFASVRCVLIGQDPYPGRGVADGLAFSTSDSNPTPASLRNIVLEWQREFGIQGNPRNDLTYLAEQGVLLFNTALVGLEGTPMFFAKERVIRDFSTAVISALSARLDPIVFILLGKKAQEFGSLIDTSRHFILEAAHPSPLSARHGFFGSNVFGRCNDQLKKLGQLPIVWLSE